MFLKYIISALVVGTVVAQPRMSVDGDNINFRFERQGDLVFERLVPTSISDLADRVAAVESNKLTDNEVSSGISTIQSQALAISESVMQPVVDSIDAVESAAASTVESQLVELAPTIDDSLSTLLENAQSLSRASNAEVEINRRLTESRGMIRTIAATMNTINATVTSDSRIHLLNKLNQSMGSSQVPVFRWQKFHTHQHGISWFDENRQSGYGGIHPSTWTDSNARAYQMSDNWAILRRLLIRKGTAHPDGATVCADTYNMFSSTDGLVCIAAFRIKNTLDRQQTWQPPITITSWHGWGESASVSVNGDNTWSSSCNWECHTSVNIPLPAREEPSTVIFVATGSERRHTNNNKHERAVVLMFRDLQLPDGLEYVDDVDTLSGPWKA